MGIISVHLFNRLIFVTDVEQRSVLSYTIDGKDRKVIADGLYEVNAMTIDHRNYKLYWGDSYSDV